MPEVAAAFEENGFESIWIPEHLVFPAEMPPYYPYSDDGYPPVTPDTPSYDPWVLLAYLAAATQRIRLATNILHPSVAPPAPDGPIGGHCRPGIGRPGHSRASASDGCRTSSST